LKRAVEKQENKWHLLRSRLLSEAEAAPYKYTFLQCGKKLLIELNGQKKATVNYLGDDVHLYTPAHSTMCSPAQPFLLKSPPMASIPSLSDFSGLDEDADNLLLSSDYNKFEYAVKRLSDEQIDEGIEENYWEMRRIRMAAEKNQTPLGADFKSAQMWMDAAYDEKQARREESENVYDGIV
jgi:hypothetical protein